MTTRPRAKRFVLRLSDDVGAAPPPVVAPVVAPAGAPARAAAPPAAPAPSRAAIVAAAATAPRAPAPAAPSAAAPAPSTAGLADEDSAPPPAAPAPAPAPAAAPTAAAASAPTAAAAPAPASAPTAAAASAPASAPVQAAAPEAPPPPAEPAAEPPAEPAAEPGGPEQLTGRQLRLAQRVAHKNGIRATTGLEAVRLLRERGIDPFKLDTMLDIAEAGTDPAAPSESRALATTEPVRLPETRRTGAPDKPAGKPAAKPAPLPSSEARSAEIRKIQRDIVRRRRRRLVLLAARLAVFVWLPTLVAAWYFFVAATPLFATNTEFVIQQADSSQSSQIPGVSSMLAGTGMGTAQDSTTVQSFLQSREAMRRLDAEQGFIAYWQNPDIDALRRLPPDATQEAAYRLFQRMVTVAFDPMEGIIRMEVVAADPETSERFARALVAFAEEQVDSLTQRLRENQMRDALLAVEQAEDRAREAQMRVLELQERFQVLSSEVEVSLLTQQITTLEGQLNQERLSLSDLRANARPNSARLAQTERRISALEDQIATLRATLTTGGVDGSSLARVQRELVMGEADVATRQLLLQQAMAQLESARIEANRQVRFLSMGVSPIASDEAAYPRKWENTALAFLAFAGIYLMLSMTASILREQVTA